MNPQLMISFVYAVSATHRRRLEECGMQRWAMGGWRLTLSGGELFVSRFETLTLVVSVGGDPYALLREAGLEEAVLHLLRAPERQELNVREGAEAGRWYIKDGEVVYDGSEAARGVIAYALAQSSALEVLELQTEEIFAEAGRLEGSIGTKQHWNRRPYNLFAARAMKLRREAVASLYLLDKPELLWESEALDGFYDELAAWLELKERFKVIEYKLSLLQETVEIVVTAIDQARNEALEWAIVILIVIEIAVMVLDMIKGG